MTVVGPGDELVRYSAADGVAVLTLSRPPVNAFSSDLFEAIGRAAERLSADDSVRVAILTAEGRRMFSAGADVKELATLTVEGRAEFFARSNEARRKFAAIPVPVIAAINGPAVGAGITYATRCDYRIAADHAYFLMAEIDRGSVAGGGANFLAIGVPSGAMRMLLYSGRRHTAAEALAMHLVDEVVPYAALMDVARGHAATIATKSRAGLIAMKSAIAAVGYSREREEADLATTQRMTADLTERPETKEGLRAFLEKRPPRY